MVHDWLGGPSAEAWQPRVSYSTNLVCQMTGLFALCMLCHGELVRLRPKAGHLTSFYLMISAGGALGGLSVSLIAPLVFKTYAEWKISLCVGFVLAAVVAFALAGPKGWRLPRLGLPNVLRAVGILLSLVALAEIAHLLENDSLSSFPVLERSRDFYGVLTVSEEIQEDPPSPVRSLLHGGTRHGMQFTAPTLQRLATTYYSPESGLGQTLNYYRDVSVQTREQLRIGVVGLGVGTVATYADLPWHSVRFYEINPEVNRLAEKYFTYLADARARRRDGRDRAR